MVELDGFMQILVALGVPSPEKEYRFCPSRRWRVDYAWPEHKLAVEIEGGVWVYGRHNRPGGFMGDIEKYNALTMEGYHLLRFTPHQIKTGEAYFIIGLWFNKKDAR
jgi:very-short-patch-repair endonuclease